MAVFLQQHPIMKNFYLLTFSLLTIISLTACQSAYAQNAKTLKDLKGVNILYFNPEVFPDIEEIKDPTYSAFYAAVSERNHHFRNYKMLRVDSYIPFDSVDAESIMEFCRNNNAQFAIVPKVKYFKVGFGKYIFSNQVIVSLKMFDSAGKMVSQTDYDTFKKNARILGSAENSIKIGTEGAMNNMAKDFSKSKRFF